jgi:hypothetical protein
MSIVGRNCDEHLGSPSLDLSLPICEKKERKKERYFQKYIYHKILRRFQGMK